MGREACVVGIFGHGYQSDKEKARKRKLADGVGGNKCDAWQSSNTQLQDVFSRQHVLLGTMLVTRFGYGWLRLLTPMACSIALPARGSAAWHFISGRYVRMATAAQHFGQPVLTCVYTLAVPMITEARSYLRDSMTAPKVGRSAGLCAQQLTSSARKASYCGSGRR